MVRPTIAAQLYTVREYTKTASDLAATLKKVRAIGYSAVQISAIGPIPDAEVKAMLDGNGLKCCITHVREAWPWTDVPGIIAQHKLWNCPNVAVGSMPNNYRAGGEEGIKKFAAEANAVGKQLYEAGLTFSYHNHSFEFVRYGKRTGLEMLYGETDPRYVKAELDTYWVQHGGGDPIAWIKKMAGRMPVVHFKDMIMLYEQKPGEAGSYRQTMAEIGEGNLNWPGIIAACQEIGVEWAAIEQDICQRDPFESLKISYENLKGMGLR